MKEIVKMVASKTGMSEAMARSAVEIVIAQLKTKLPQGISSQIDSILGDDAKGSKSSNPLGGLMGNLGGMLGKKK